MDYPETLSFVARCLSLAKHPERDVQIKQHMRSGKIDWEKVVRVSSGHYVLPAFYVCLREANLLVELPPDLTEHLEYLTNLNRERNKDLLEQAEEINQLLTSQGIYPVFLKGTAFLLSGLYNDIAERMIGDIDLLVPEGEMEVAANILVSHGYKPLVNFNKHIHSKLKHYPRLTTVEHPAAVEVHQQVLITPHDRKYPAKDILQHKQKPVAGNNLFVPSYRDMMIHNALNVQLNDKAYLYHIIHLRHMYDMLLLSMKEDPNTVFEHFGHYKNQVDACLLITSEMMGSPGLFPKKKTAQLKFYLYRHRLFLKRTFAHKAYNVIIYLAWRFSRYFATLGKAISNKDERLGLYARLNNPKWYGQHLKSYSKHFGL